jgi:hypothetical protein
MKLSQAQALCLQGLVIILAGAITAALTAGYQELTTGHVDQNTLVAFLFSSFLVALGKALAAYIPAHIPEALQAVQDTQQEIIQLLHQQQNATVPMPVPAAPPVSETASTLPVPAVPPRPGSRNVPWPMKPVALQPPSQRIVPQAAIPIVPQAPTDPQADQKVEPVQQPAPVPIAPQQAFPSDANNQSV